MILSDWHKYPKRLIVDKKTWKIIYARMENPRKPTKAMRSLLSGGRLGKANDRGVWSEIRATELLIENPKNVTGYELMGLAEYHPGVGLTKRQQDQWDAGYLSLMIRNHR